MLFRQKRPVQQHNISISGGTKDIKYLVSGKYDRQEGMQRAFPDVFNRYNLRSKIDFRINKWATLSNNSSFFSSKYTSLGDGSIDNTLAYSSRHALACFPMQNPDGSWLYATPYIDYKVGNGRHIMLNEGTHRNVDRTSDFSNTTRLVITPFKTLSITGDFTYRFYQARNTSRSSEMWYRQYPDSELESYNTGAGETSWTKTSRPVISTRPTSMPATTRPSATHTICRPRPVSTTSSSYGKRYRHGDATSRRSIWTTSTSSARTKTVRRRPECRREVRPNTVCWDSSRPYQLRLQGTLSFRGERPLRRHVALLFGEPLGMVPVGVGGLAYLGRAFLRSCEEGGRQPQTARFVRFAGQPECIVLLHLPATGLD